LKYLRLLLALLFLAPLGASAALKSVLQVTIGSGPAYTYMPTTNLQVMYSLRLAVSGYAGNAIKLRRASDNTTQDIGFSGTDLNVSAASTFCSGTLCFVAEWYDQSGNAVHAIQATTSKQPGFMFAADGTHAAVTCGGRYGTTTAQQFLLAGSVLALTGDQTIGGVFDPYSSVLGYAFGDRDLTTPFNGWMFGTGTGVYQNAQGTAYWGDTQGTWFNDGNNPWTTRPMRLGLTRTSGTVQFYQNGTAGAGWPNSGNGTPTAHLSVCGASDASVPFSGGISELYAYSSALTGTDLTNLNSSESAYFTTSTPAPYAGASALSFGGTDQSIAVDQFVITGAGKFTYERTQAWTAFGAVQLLGVPPLGSIIFSNAQTSSAFPGYELWVDSSCFAHVRIISNIATPNYIGKVGSVHVCDGTWHMLAASYDGSSTAAGVLLYEDGVIDPAPTVESDTLSASIVSGTQTFTVGNQTAHGDFFVRGALDEFSLHNVVRDATYIGAHSSPSSLPTIDGNTVLMYHFDDNTGFTAADASGGGNPGTLTSNLQWWPGPTQSGAVACTSTCMTTPLLAGASSSNPSTSALNYTGMIGGSGSGYGTSLANMQMPIATAGTISNLQVSFPQGIGSGTWRVTLNTNGIDRAVTCTISSGTTCSDTTHTYTVAPSDLLIWEICPSGATNCQAGSAPTAQTAPIQISATFTSITGQASPLFAGLSANTNSATAINYTSVGGWSAPNATENLVSVVIPAAGTIDQLFVQPNSSAGAGGLIQYTIEHGGSDTSLTCTTAINGTQCVDLDPSHAFTVAQGETISLKSCPSNTATCPAGSAPSARLALASMRWTPTTTNQAIMLSNATTMPTSAATRFGPVGGSSANASAEGAMNVVPAGGPWTISNLTVKTAPTPSTSKTITLRTGDGTTQGSQSPTCTVTNPATTCTDATSSPSLTQGTFVDEQFTGTSGTFTQFKTGVVISK
jgi:hypothetical protein